ncbi:hypothetical protein FCH28_10365 [Streptomyces piniterrae]|uniref:Uncharacterized protein n=1 Tax=Streptomyces piniterrae TaxID=2571125 RepID=A0A4U0NMN5_9ACTN|nr:hypothetical protein [Streptomyces piniterrae]TJZ55711.1 hypothetical protein FCH28_10365 [Streptomyces piniterrae]
MLAEALTALATAGGTAVVQAASTEEWTTFRRRLAGWFGRGDTERERAELARLEQTAAALEAAGPDEAERVRIRQEAGWEARFATLLESLEDGERERVAAELRALLEEHQRDMAAGGVSAGAGGLAVGGNVEIRAEGGSIAAGVINGGAQIGPRPSPDPSQG